MWRYSGEAAWYFVSLPTEVGAAIHESFRGLSSGFGSLKVEVTLGATVWRTSIFWESKAQTYLLPIKAQVRKAERLTDGDTVRLSLKLLQV